MKSVLLFAFLSATSVFSKSNLYQKVMMMQDDQSKDQSLTVPDSLTHVEELNFAQAPDQIQDQKVDKVDNFIENQMSAFIVSDKKETVLATGKRQEWNLFSHPAYPRYALRTKTGSKLCDPNVHQISGYLDVDDEKHFYFWFFESRSKPKTDPLVLWLNGGPGCSSLTGLLMELGPCKPTVGGENTTTNEFSWTNNANVIFLDQPVNVGFSYSEGKGVTNSDDAAQDVLAFLQIFIQTYPKYSVLPFTVTGESYAGHYIPAIANAIFNSNELVASNQAESGVVQVNMVSIAIGNGLTDPLIQYEYYPDMACDTKYGPILPEETCDEMRSKYPTCKNLISACYSYKSPFTCVPGSFYCNSAMIQPFQSTGLNIYDIRKECGESNPLCYDILNDIESYLNDPSVQEELGVDIQYEGCKRDINMNFLLAGDWMRPYVEYIPQLLESGIKVLIYAGDADYICNWIGNKAWTEALEWSGQEEFNEAKDIVWKSKITGKEAGELKMYGNFAFLRVYEAGHMVPYDQPEHSLEMINVFLHETAKHSQPNPNKSLKSTKREKIKKRRGGLKNHKKH